MLLLGIGSNLPSKFGDRYENIKLAIKYIKENKIKIIKKSSYYETPSYPDKEKPKFINVVIEIFTNLSFADLVSILISIEEILERKRNKKNDPRTCDIDIIDFNKKIEIYNFNNSIFKVPHESLSSRNFVLYPLMEILPDWEHPVSKLTVKELINNLEEDKKKSILKIEKNWYN